MKNTGGPAFPFQAKSVDGSHWSPEYGMTLRDYFAGQALIGLTCIEGGFHPNIISEKAYEMADVMLKKREK